jgi:hypothetical protein
LYRTDFIFSKYSGLLLSINDNAGTKELKAAKRSSKTSCTS